MHIAVHLGSQLMSEAIYQLLACSGYDNVVVIGRSPTKGFTPQVLLIDSTTLRQDLLAQYPEARVLLMDTGTEPEQLRARLLSFRITRGTFPPYGTPPVQEGPHGNQRGKAMDRRRDG